MQASNQDVRVPEDACTAHVLETDGRSSENCGAAFTIRPFQPSAS